MATDSHKITALLARFRSGDRTAENELLELVYGELRQIAARRLSGESRGHVLQPTALINEAYLRLRDLREKEWVNRQHFFAVAAQVMRRVLIDDARKRKAAKRGGAVAALPLRDEMAATEFDPDQLIEADEALKELAAFDERQARIVELYFFGGLTIDEIASELSLSVRTIIREMNLAKAWLACRVSGIAP